MRACAPDRHVLPGKALLRTSLRLLLKPVLGPRVPIALQRRWVDAVAALGPSAKRLSLASQTMNGVPAECVRADGADSGRVILFLHGGGYCVGSPRSHRALAGQLAFRAAACVYAPDYRLAPEHPCPAALDDALSAYRWLLARDVAAGSIVLVGDSAGGGLALSLALALRNRGQPLPAALVLLSPWVDLGLSGASQRTHAARDPMLSMAGLQRWSAAYRATLAADDPVCSPLYANLRGLPPLLIQVGSEEVLLDDARRLQQRAQAAGVDVQLQEYAGLWHDFQLQAGLVAEAGIAIAAIARFIDGRCALPPGAIPFVAGGVA